MTMHRASTLDLFDPRDRAARAASTRSRKLDPRAQCAQPGDVRGRGRQRR
ncbi:MAG: hypothetical protein MZV49_18770 [Rhodopseudomonas palustris]|nr:hypothetical protein [Rhodopseudomonas palustris]